MPADPRERHRERHWRTRDVEGKQCPRCGRPIDAGGQPEVHHNDEDHTNGHPGNLRSRCRACHQSDEHDNADAVSNQPGPTSTGPPRPSGTGPR